MKIPRSIIRSSAGMVDLQSPTDIEIIINANGSTMWINIDGICRLRIYRMRDTHFTVDKATLWRLAEEPRE